MEYCMKFKRWKESRIVGLFVVICLFLLPIICSVLLVIEGGSPMIPVYCIGICAFGIVMFLNAFNTYRRQGRKFSMDENGITVSYFPKRKRFYPWKAFFGIVVCDFGHSTKYPSNCYLIIRMAAFDEDDGPYSKNPSRTFYGIEKWRGYKYTEKNFDKIVFLGYSPELLDEVRRLSKLPVTYSLTQYGEALMAQNKADGNWDR